MKKIYLSLCGLLLASFGFSQVNLSNASASYQQTFDAMGVSATATVPTGFKVSTSTLPRTIGSYSSATTATMYAGGANMSATATPGIYNYAAGDPATVTERSLGALGGGTVQSANFYLYLKNTGTSGIDNFTISFDVEKYRRGTNSGNAAMTLYYSSDGTNFISATSNGIAAATFVADPDNNGPATVPAATTRITGTFNVSVGANSDIYLAWNYSPVTGTFGANDAIGLGLDSIKITANYSILPVRLANFKAQQRANAVDISWSAFNESDMLRHEIEKSTNGSAFNVIGAVDAQNNGTTYAYDFIDATPVYGNNYYRLKSISKTGDVSYSSTLLINMGATRTDMVVLNNPVINRTLNLQLANMEKGQYAINIFSSVGQKMYTQSMNLSGGSSTEMISLPANVSRGVYMVQLTNGSYMITKQILVQ